MEELFNTIINSFHDLWKMKIHGATLEIITPMVTANDNFVSVFVTRRGESYVVTDGGWIESGMYDCEPDSRNITFHRIFKYYIDNYGISIAEGNGKKFYFKKISDINMVPSLVFDLSNFTSCVINTAFIPLMSDRETNTFKRNVKNYLADSYGEDSFEYDRALTPEMGIKFSAIKREGENVKLINFVSGANATNYANTLCRSNTNFDMIESSRQDLHIEKTVTLLDDRKQAIIDSNLVRPYYSYLMGKSNDDNKVVLWNEHQQLREII